MSWRRSERGDPGSRTASIELITSEMPKKVFGWVGDNHSKFRKDFRLGEYIFRPMLQCSNITKISR